MTTALTSLDGVTRCDWNTTLGELCDQFGGGIQTGPFGSQLHASDYSEDGTPVVMPQDLVDGRIVCDRIARVPERIVCELSRHALRLGDVVFSRRGDVTRFAVVTHEQEGWLCGTGCIRIRLNCPDVDIPYFRHYLLQRSVGKWLIHQAKGVTMPNLNTEIVRALPLVYPPLEEQRRIATILDKADALRQKRRLALQKLDSLTQSIFFDMFGDPRETHDGIIRGKLGEMCVQVTDGEHITPRRSTEGFKLLSARNIRNGYLDYSDVDYVDEAEFRRISPRCAPRSGDLLMSCSGTIGRVSVVRTEEPIALVQSAALIRTDPELVRPDYLESWLQLPWTNQLMQQRANASSQANLFQNQIRDLPLAVPNMQMQDEFCVRKSVVRRIAERQIAFGGEIGDLFRSLQHRAFRGEL